MAQQLDVIIEQGANFVQTWQIDNKQLATGYSFLAKFRPQHASTTTVLTINTFTAVHSGQHTNLSCNVSASTTDDLPAPSQGVYDIEYTQTSTGAVTRAFEGTYYVTPEATK
jgi:hypothetical protein